MDGTNTSADVAIQNLSVSGRDPSQTGRPRFKFDAVPTPHVLFGLKGSTVHLLGVRFHSVPSQSLLQEDGAPPSCLLSKLIDSQTSFRRRYYY